MKIRLAKKIMKQARHLSTASDYWYRRLRDFEYKICYGFIGKKDHRITKAMSLTKKKQRMKKDVFNKATKLSRNIEEINKVIDSSNDLKHPCYRSLFSSSLLTLMDDDDFNKHFLSFLKNEKKLNEEMFNSL